MKKILLEIIDFSRAMGFLIAHLCKNITVGWLHLLQQKYISWCLITDMRLPWKPNSTISLIQAKFQESNCLQFSLFFCFSLLVKMTNRRWHQEQRNLQWSCPAAVLAAYDQIRGIPDADQMMVVPFVFFLERGEIEIKKDKY